MGFFFPGFGTSLELIIVLASVLVLWYYLWQIFWPRIRKKAGIAPDYDRRTEELMQSYRRRQSNGMDEQT